LRAGRSAWWTSRSIGGGDDVVVVVAENSPQPLTACCWRRSGSRSSRPRRRSTARPGGRRRLELTEQMHQLGVRASHTSSWSQRASGRTSNGVSAEAPRPALQGGACSSAVIVRCRANTRARGQATSPVSSAGTPGARSAPRRAPSRASSHARQDQTTHPPDLGFLRRHGWPFAAGRAESVTRTSHRTSDTDPRRAAAPSPQARSGTARPHLGQRAR
jgi:hypothetical protein